MSDQELPGKQFSNLARSIAARRESGFLVYSNEVEELGFLFYQGRLVDGRRNGRTLTQEILARMSHAGIDIPLEVFPETEGSYDKLILCSAFQGRGVQQVRFYLEHLLMDYIFTLQSETEGTCRFESRVVSFNRDVAPSISIGRILLDIVALQEDPHLFSLTFPADSEVRLVGEVDLESLSQVSIGRVLIKGDSKVRDLKQSTGLSQFEFQETLLEMLAAGQVILSGAEETFESSNEFPLATDVSASVDSTDVSVDPENQLVGERVLWGSEFNRVLLSSDTLPTLLHQMFIIVALLGFLRGFFVD